MRFACKMHIEDLLLLVENFNETCRRKWSAAMGKS